MTWARVWLARLATLFHRNRLERELDEELKFHFDREIERNVAAGMTPERARQAARRSFGGLAQTREAYRDARGIPLLESILRDVRYAVRALWANPGFSVTAIVSLALGIGANSAVFTVVNAALLRNLPVREPEQLVMLGTYWQGQPRDLSYPVYHALEQRQRSLDAIGASGSFRLLHAVFDGEELGEEQAVRGGFVSTNYFSFLGLQPATGRFFVPEDSRVPGEGQVAVLSHRFWLRSFGGKPDVIGRTLVLNEVPVSIVGVAPAGFSGDRQAVLTDLWVPMLMQPRLSGSMLERRTATWFRTIGRLKPGVSIAHAEAELTVLLRQDVLNAGDYKGPSTDLRVSTVPIATGLLPQERAALWGPFRLLLAVVALVLLVACCNVANLLLARGSARQRETGVRLAMGSSRARLIGQALTESLLLASVGGAAGYAAAVTGVRGLQALMAGVLPQSLRLETDARVFWFTAGISVLSGVLFGLIPAIQGSDTRLEATLRTSSRTQTGSRPRQRTSRVLVVAQVGLSLWLLVGAGLVLQSLRNYRALDLGFDRRNLITFDISPERRPGSVESADTALQREIVERIQFIPGVASAGFSVNGLFSSGGVTAPVRVPTSNVNPTGDPDLQKSWVSPEFFRTMGMTLLRGRLLAEADSRLAVVNENVARHYFGDESPLGKMIYFPKVDEQNRYVPFGTTFDPEQGVEIVGVVRDARQNIKGEATRLVYLPLNDRKDFPNALYVRTSGDPEPIAAQARRALRKFKGRLVVINQWVIDERVDGGLGQERLLSRLLSFFGVLGLILASVGLFGVLSYSVVRRTGEIGIRMALGARRLQVIRAVLGETLKLALAGIALGVPAALASTKLIQGFLFGLSPTDPVTIATVAAVLVAVSLLAGFVPARRASRVDPVVALRHE